MSSRTDVRYQLIHLEEVDSTQRFALDNLGLFSNNTLITCTSQKAGYGRQQSKWLDSSKNLAFTFVFNHQTTPAESHRVALYLAKALNQTLRDYGLDTRIKWPNDIYLLKKIAGILIDYRDGKFIVGIGVNLAEDFEQFEKTGIEVEKTQLARIIATNILDTLSEDYSKVLEYCNDNSYLYDREVEVKGLGTIVVKHLDESGNLHYIKDGSQHQINMTVFSLKK